MLMERGCVTPVPMLRRKPGGRRFRLIGRAPRPALAEGPQADPAGRARADRHAVRERRPRQGHQALHRLRSRRQMDRRPRRQPGHRQPRPQPSSTSSSPQPRSRSPASRSTAAPSSGPSSSRPAPRRASPSSCCRPSDPSSTAPSSAANPGATSSTPVYDLPHRLDKLQPLVDAFAHRFNHHRPHQALGDSTPAEYLNPSARTTPAVSYVLKAIGGYQFWFHREPDFRSIYQSVTKRSGTVSGLRADPVLSS